MTNLIQPADLAAVLDDPRIRVVDASWHLDGRDGRAEFEQVRIPGAVFFDLEVASDTDTPLPHMLPTDAAFADYVGGLGIGADDRIVVYDSVGLFSAPRVWWMFRLMGASDVRVLDGGLPAWRAAGLPVEGGPARELTPAVFTARRRKGDVVDMPTVMAALSGDAAILDARPAARFQGQAPEPRPGLRAGHMPGALNLPYKDLLTEAGSLRAPADLAARFAEAGLDPDLPVITTCGSGVSAAILTLALSELGRDSAVYDGSWAEWGGRADTLVEIGNG